MGRLRGGGRLRLREHGDRPDHRPRLPRRLQEARRPARRSAADAGGGPSAAAVGAVSRVAAKSCGEMDAIVRTQLLTFKTILRGCAEKVIPFSNGARPLR